MSLPQPGTNRGFSFARRADLVETMERPDCSLTKLHRTLDQFRWINAWLSRYRYLLRRHVIGDMLRQPERVWRLLDLGAGGCDITVWLLREAARRGLRVTATALERDPRVVAYARAKHGSSLGLTITAGDALNPSCWEPADYVFANHFLHHLDDEEAVRFLRLAGANTRRLFLLSDIRRSPAAYWACALVIGLLAHRSFALGDGLMSVRQGFLPDELQSLLRAADLDVASSVQTLFPFRVAVIGGPAFSRPTINRD